LTHPNIVLFFGMYSNDKDRFLVFEFVSGGSLLDYLVQHDAELSQLQKLDM